MYAIPFLLLAVWTSCASVTDAMKPAAGKSPAPAAAVSTGTLIAPVDELILLAKKGDLTRVRAYVQTGAAGPETPSKDGLTPMAAACIAGSRDVAGYFIGIGADPGWIWREGGYLPLISLAARAGKADVVRMLAEYGVDVNQVSKIGWAPIHYAAAGGHVEVIRVLVSARARILFPTPDRKLPSDLAREAGFPDAASLLGG